MAKIHGVIINLKQSKVRKSELIKHLKILGVADRYELFSAYEGSEKEAKQRNLSKGELGLWITWIKLLEEKIKTDDSEYDYIHIIEDDVRLSREFLEMGDLLSPSKPEQHLMVTDMYVNPNIYTHLAKVHNKAIEEGKIIVTDGEYTGCTASVIMHKEYLKDVLKILKNVYEADRKLLPLDNALRSEMKKGNMKIYRTIPFLTSIDEECQKKSTIQTQDNKTIQLSQEFCNILRQELSTIKRRDNATGLMEIFNLIIRERELDESKEFKDKLIQMLTDFAINEKILKYKYYKNLIGEPDNRQKQNLIKNVR